MPNRERYGREGNQSGRREREQGDQPYQESGWRGHRQFDESEGMSGHVRDWPEGRREENGGRERFEDFSERRGYGGSPWENEQRGQRYSQSGTRQGSGYGPGSESLGGYGREEGGYGQGGYGQGGDRWEQSEESRRRFFPGQGQQGGYRQGGYGQPGGYGQGYEQGSQSWGGQGGYGQRESGQRGSGQGTGYGERQWEQGGFGGNYGQGSQGGMGRGEHGSWGQQFGRGMSGGRGQQQGRFSGRGPKGYKRSDDRIKEDISEEMSHNGELDATDIEIKVSNGEVTLTGFVESRQAKRMAEELSECASGVKEVHNQLRVKSQDDQQHHQSAGSPSSSQHGTGSESSSRSSSRS